MMDTNRRDIRVYWNWNWNRPRRAVVDGIGGVVFSEEDAGWSYWISTVNRQEEWKGIDIIVPRMKR
jgi:hypothetical protein